MIINSDASEVLKQAQEFARMADKAEQALEEALDWWVADAGVRVAHRVKQEGRATNGSTLMTRSRNPVGRYGQQHGKARQEKGLQTARVDLYFTGDMWRDWNITERRRGRRGLGFLSEASNQKATELEQLYRTPIFVPSDDDDEDSFKKSEQIFFNEIQRR